MWFVLALRTDRKGSTYVHPVRLALRLEQGLQLTWDAFAEVMTNLGPDWHNALHPHLISPRMRRMAEQRVAPESPALGIS